MTARKTGRESQLRDFLSGLLHKSTLFRPKFRHSAAKW
jgi:hypothetical protein